jgi:DNA-binding response OmpR family regulator
MSAVLLLATRDEDARIIYKTYLSHRGYTVLTTESGDEGFRLCLESGVRLVIFDPPVSLSTGETLAQALRKHHATSDVPILGVTAWLGVFESGLEGNEVTEYLLKPLPPVVLAEVVDRLIGGKPQN